MPLTILKWQYVIWHMVIHALQKSIKYENQVIFGTNNKELMKNDFYVSAKNLKQYHCSVDVNLLA